MILRADGEFLKELIYCYDYMVIILLLYVCNMTIWL